MFSKISSVHGEAGHVCLPPRTFLEVAGLVLGGGLSLSPRMYCLGLALEQEVPAEATKLHCIQISDRFVCTSVVSLM
jgi:hypothetical protein